MQSIVLALSLVLVATAAQAAEITLVLSVKLQIGDRDNRAIIGMAVTGATTAGGNNIMNGEAIAGTHMDRRHRRAITSTMIIVAIIVRGLTNIIAKYQCRIAIRH